MSKNTYEEYSELDFLNLPNDVKIAGYVYVEPKTFMKGKEAIKLCFSQPVYNSDRTTKSKMNFQVLDWNPDSEVLNIKKGDLIIVTGRWEVTEGKLKPEEIKKNSENKKQYGKKAKLIYPPRYNTLIASDIVLYESVETRKQTAFGKM